MPVEKVAEIFNEVGGVNRNIGEKPVATIGPGVLLNKQAGTLPGNLLNDKIFYEHNAGSGAIPCCVRLHMRLGSAILM